MIFSYVDLRAQTTLNRSVGDVSKTGVLVQAKALKQQRFTGVVLLIIKE
jgi:hypothetical protein